MQVACLTGNHQKEWRYYTHDVEAFLDAFNACLAGHPAYPCSCAYKDPDWNALSGLQPKLRPASLSGAAAAAARQTAARKASASPASHFQSANTPTRSHAQRQPM